MDFEGTWDEDDHDDMHSLFVDFSSASDSHTSGVEIIDVPVDLFYLQASLGIIGILGNVFVLAVLNKIPKSAGYYRSVYLFKAQAMSDIMYLIPWYPFALCKRNGNANTLMTMFFSVLAFGNRKLGLLITLILAITRVVSMYHCCHYLRSVRRGRCLRYLLVCSLTYCILLQGFVDSDLIFKGFPFLLDIILRRVVGYMLPDLLMVGLMMAIAWQIRYYQIQRSTRPLANSLPAKGLDESYGVMLVVLAMCSVSFLTFFVPPLAITLIKTTKLWLRYKKILIYIHDFLGFVNSSVNIVFYLFLGQFRAYFTNLIESVFAKTSTVGVAITADEDYDT